MRRVIVLAVMLIASCAYGEIQEFTDFSLDVPEGWTAREEGHVVNVNAYDGSASLTITTDKPGESTIGELAEMFSRELGGTVPEKDEDDNYSFEFSDGDGQAVITGDSDFYMLIIGTGIDTSNQIGEILDSLEMK